ncbi:MarR family winged helix-turn-helix transcriptional regulator [Janthinobacterium agaricidamnosum]|uniref:MarR family protein n=1 Tax=Janthinobacterium agaricidamnosum NBRC 102515 = DSM 9628 TaxID=1349767 RepID=W0VAN4_9BURK|nr:MarR family transcriptional regulator [Janthinobacterium agaricidamnosum]CDG84660.1 marR family protein [Janthinobacterium agaricidamnosum NBRC 102515 = DSM 9628]
MTAFEANSKRLQYISTLMPDFPLELMRLARMTSHIQKGLKDSTNAALKKHDLTDVSYMVLAVLYGTEDASSNARTLGIACNEKPANLTRVCNELEQRGLIHRGSRPGDRRSVMITLTDAGRALICLALPDVYRRNVHVYDGFNAEELQQLEKMFARQLHNLSCLD